MAKPLLARLAAFVALFVLSGLLLTIFPLYPLYILIVLALGVGAIAVFSPDIALRVAVLLSILGAMYQNVWAGVTLLVAFLITLALTFGSGDEAYVVVAWILAFLTPLPSLAIAPALVAGIHKSRKDAAKVGLASGLTVFLLGWAMGLMHAGLMLVPAPASYVIRAIPTPWDVTAILPSANAFTIANFTNYYASLIPNLTDFRIYVLIAAWGIAGYLTAVLASKLKSPRHYASSLFGVIPAVVVAFLFGQAPPLEIVTALVAGVAIAPVYTYVGPLVERLSQVRKVATIMFTDVVGYTAITQNDEALALRILEAQKKTLRPIFQKHGGLEVKMIGDAFLIEFASPLEAVNCAVEIQRTLRDEKLAGHETQLHIGIHVGEVVHLRGDVFGDVVNVASRLESTAAAGEICISRDVYDQISNKTNYQLTPLGEKKLKNVKQPVEVYSGSPGKV